MVFFDQNTLAGDWRAQVRYCRQNGIALSRYCFRRRSCRPARIAGRSSPHAGSDSRYICTDLPQRSGKSRSPESSSPRSWNVTTIRRRRLIASVPYSPSRNSDLKRELRGRQKR